MRFDRHTAVLLVRPADAPELSFGDQDDERLRGIAVMSVDAEQARRLYTADPAVRAGRLAVEVMTWQVRRLGPLRKLPPTAIDGRGWRGLTQGSANA